MRAILKSSSLVLRRLSTLFATQAGACTEQIAALRSRAGLSSLPDEIISSVLQYAVFDSESEIESPFEGGAFKAYAIIHSVNTAVKLSSVCSRLRSLAVNTPDLWNQVCVGMPQEMLATCIERAKSTGLGVFFDITFMDFETPRPRARPLLEFVMPFVGTWRRFDHHCLPYLSSGSSFPETGMKALQIVLHNMHAPRLSELTVWYQANDPNNFHEGFPEEEGFDRTQWKQMFHFYSSWTLPALQSMSTTNLIPIPFSGSASIQKLYVEMDYSCNETQEIPFRPFDAVGLLEFLFSCPVLRELTLQLVHATVLTDARSVDRFNMETVEELVLGLDSCSSSSIDYFMNAVRFPQVTAMKFAIVCREDGVDSADLHPSGSVKAVFSKPDVFPRLTQLQFIARSTTPIRIQTHLIPLPIHNIPNLKTLHVRTRGVTIEPPANDLAIPTRLSSVYVDDPHLIGSYEWFRVLQVRAQRKSESQPLEIFLKPPSF